MAKEWLITFYPEMSMPWTVPARFDHWLSRGGGLPALTAGQANDHARAWALPSDERKPRVFFGRPGEGE